MNEMNNIEAIVAEILRDDPKLLPFKKEIYEAVCQVLKLRPDIVIDPVFMADLRKKLLVEVDSTTIINQFNLIARMRKTMKPALYGGVFLILLAVSAGTYIAYQEKHTSSTAGGTSKITKVGANAFGALSMGGGAVAENSTRQTSDQVIAAPSAGSASTLMLDTSMVAPQDYTQVVYSYKGKSLTQTAANLEVLKRIPGRDVKGVSSLLNSDSFSLIKPSGLDKAEVKNISFTMDGEKYQVDIDFVNGRLNINSDWAKIDSASQIGDVKESDIPTNENSISIAKDFIHKFGINIDGYASPKVIDWKSSMRLYGNAKEEGVPNAVTVFYPLMVQGRHVYDSNGSEFGISIVIDVRTKKVTSLQNLVTTSFESSLYEAETDPSRLLEIVTSGGVERMIDAAAKTEEALVGDPELAYVLITKYEQNKQIDLLAPAYVFPVTYKASVYTQERVVVPLIKDLLTRQVLPVNAATTTSIEPAVSDMMAR